MRAPALAIAILLSSASAIAQEMAPGESSAACDGFDWSLKREQAWFSAPDLPRVESGGILPSGAPAALLVLKPIAEAALPKAPTRASKPDTYAGVLNIAAPTRAAAYQITLSDEGWIDVVQDGGARSPAAHTGKRNCPGLRKSLRFELAARPFAITVSNATGDMTKIAVTPVP